MEKKSMDERIDKIRVEYKSDHYRRAQEFKKLLKEAEKSADLPSIGKINMYLANCIVGQGKRGSMLAYAYKAVSIFENGDDRFHLARSLNLMGIAYASQGNFQRAITAYNRAMKVIHGRNYPFMRRDTLLNNIGDAYFQMGAYQKSLRIAMDCFSTCRKDQPINYDRVVVFGMNVCDSYCALGKFQEAKESLDNIQPEVGQIVKSVFLAGYYTRRSYVAYALDDLEGGAKYVDQVIELVHENYDSYENHPLFEKIVSYQISIGDFERAQCLSDSLAKYADENGHMLDVITAKRVQASICYATGERDRALSLYLSLSMLYEDWTKEQKAIQYESQKSVETAAREIGKLMQKIRVSEEKAARDPLTGLRNRSSLVNVTDAFLRNAKEKGKPIGALFMDIDYFKEYNDSYGHAAGDEAIKFIARVCLEEENANVKFFRYGGDEYFGIVYGYSNEEMEQLALRISGKVRASCYEHIKNPNGQRLTVSIGIVNVDMKNSEDTILDIIKYADKTLYHAKDRGKDAIFEYHALPKDEHEFIRISHN